MKNESLTSNGSKVMVKVKVFVTDRQKDRQTDEADLMSQRFCERAWEQQGTYQGINAPQGHNIHYDHDLLTPKSNLHMSSFLYPLSVYELSL